MAGGKGTRLYPYTKILPKTADSDWGYSRLWSGLLINSGMLAVTDFYATVNYRRNMIQSYFTDTAKDYELKVCRRESAIRNSRKLTD
ncbi:MAG: hypothetical protein ACLTDV_03905 [Eubacterium sp.]